MQGIVVQAVLAGGEFQVGYRRLMQDFLRQADMQELVQFVGQLNRSALSRFWELNHVGVFPSIYPEAFGIVGGEIMASGAALVSSAVGGAAELVPSVEIGRRYTPDSSAELAQVLRRLVDNPSELFMCAQMGQDFVRSNFDVLSSARQLERLLRHGSV